MSKVKALVLIGCLSFVTVMGGACKVGGGSKGSFKLHTRILIHESNLGSGKNLKVSVEDKRRKDTLLTKDSDRKIKSGRALVTMDYYSVGRLDANFNQTAREAFKLQGYRTDGSGTGGIREVIIYITKLDLRFRRNKMEEGDKNPFQARLRTKMKLIAKNSRKVYNNEYEFIIKKTYEDIPKEKDSEKILNYGLTQLLHQIMDDPQLNRFLTG